VLNPEFVAQRISIRQTLFLYTGGRFAGDL